MTEITGTLTDQLVALYAGTWWASDRTRDDVEEMVGGSDHVLAMVNDDDELVVRR